MAVASIWLLGAGGQGGGQVAGADLRGRADEDGSGRQRGGGCASGALHGSFLSAGGEGGVTATDVVEESISVMPFAQAERSASAAVARGGCTPS